MRDDQLAPMGVQKLSLSAPYHGFGLGVTTSSGSHNATHVRCPQCSSVLSPPNGATSLCAMCGAVGTPDHKPIPDPKPIPNPMISDAAGRGAGGWGGAACTSFFSDPTHGIALVFVAQLVGYYQTAPTLRKEAHNRAYVGERKEMERKRWRERDGEKEKDVRYCAGIVMFFNMPICPRK